MANTNNGFAKPVLLQVATKGELVKCPDMLLGRYNGHPGEDLSPLVLDNRGADYQFFWKDVNGVVRPGWPLRVREGRYVAIPNCKENLEILEKMKAHKWSERVKTDSGHIERTVDHPPLYELVTEEVAQVSPDALLQAFAKMTPEMRAQLLGSLTDVPASPTAPKFTLEEDPADGKTADDKGADGKTTDDKSGGDKGDGKKK